MNIKIKYFASLREKANTNMESLNIDSNRSLAQIYKDLALKYNFNYELYEIKFAVNNSYVDSDYILKPNDELAFIPPVAGG